MRICGSRLVRGWRHAEQDQVYDLACWCDGECFLLGVRPSHQRISKAFRYRASYAAQAIVRLGSKNRVYAWRARKRLELAARRADAREAHVAAITIADQVSGQLTAYVH